MILKLYFYRSFPLHSLLYQDTPEDLERVDRQPLPILHVTCCKEDCVSRPPQPLSFFLALSFLFFVSRDREEIDVHLTQLIIKKSRIDQ